jgi:hypothetical protein
MTMIPITPWIRVHCISSVRSWSCLRSSTRFYLKKLSYALFLPYPPLFLFTSFNSALTFVINLSSKPLKQKTWLVQLRAVDFSSPPRICHAQVCFIKNLESSPLFSKLQLVCTLLLPWDMLCHQNMSQDLFQIFLDFYWSSKASRISNSSSISLCGRTPSIFGNYIFSTIYFTFFISFGHTKW